jgi:hypothetical protein
MTFYQKIVSCKICNKRSNLNYTSKTTTAIKKCICGVTTKYTIKPSDLKTKNKVN